MEMPRVLEAWSRVLVTAQGLAEPIVELGRQAHWLGTARALEGTDRVDRRRTLLLGGSFYNFSTPAPDRATLAWAEQRTDVEQLFVPHVRASEEVAATMRSGGFLPIACGAEVALEIENGELEGALRERLGRLDYKELRRIARRCDDAYQLEWTGGAVDEELFGTIVELHAHHAERHNAPVNPFDGQALRALFDSALRDDIEVMFRRDRATAAIHQVYVALHDRPGRALYLVTQAIDRRHVPASINLYVGSLYRILQRAAAEGIHTVGLGRSGEEAKRKLGANRFTSLEHWVKPLSVAAHEAWQAIRRTA